MTKKQTSKARAAKVSNPWRRNTGKQPVAGDVLVDVRMGRGRTHCGAPAGSWFWDHAQSLRITSWRPSKFEIDTSVTKLREQVREQLATRRTKAELEAALKHMTEDRNFVRDTHNRLEDERNARTINLPRGWKLVRPERKPKHPDEQFWEGEHWTDKQVATFEKHRLDTTTKPR